MTKEENIKAYEQAAALVSDAGATFYQISTQLGLNSSFFSEWKKGKMMPSVGNLKKLADYFGVSIEYFLTEEKEKA